MHCAYMILLWLGRRVVGVTRFGSIWAAANPLPPAAAGARPLYGRAPGGPVLDDETLARLVAAFYAKARVDGALGPVFEAAVDDWPGHLETLAGFWSSVMLTTGRYKGKPLAAHRRHAASMTPAMFTRWLELWGETAREILVPDDAGLIERKAQRIAESLKLALFLPARPSAVRAAA